MPHPSERLLADALQCAADHAGAPLLLAISGGLDSMTMLHVAAAHLRVGVAAVAVFDHRTGESSRRASSLAAHTAARLGLPVIRGAM
ncbi:MAG: hypothetical protein H0W68_03100, partial [Gemmatimonadaceae bacterium]|nr:hypothetical protein [Gemmatimonadaceae bacterium]